MTDAKRRGRPPIKTFTDNPSRSRRVAVNMQYALNASAMITVNAQQIPNHELLWFSDDQRKVVKGKWGVLEQLGRMSDQDGLDQDSCISIAGLAAKALKRGHTSREVEQAIRHIRMAARQQKSGLRMAIFLLEVMAGSLDDDQ